MTIFGLMRPPKLVTTGLTTVVLMCLLSAPSQTSASPEEKAKASVSVDCKHGSGLVQVNILSTRKIGKIHLVVKDAKGKAVYIEEGKAMSEELVRRFDKGMFPKGAVTLTVEARDFNITQEFVVQ